MHKLVGFLLVLTVIMVSIPTAQAESLWVDTAPSANLFTDHRAHAVGDVITIVISEASSASRSGSSANSKSANANLDAGVGIFGFLAAASASTSDEFQSKGSIANTNKVTGRVTVKVTELKPNGQMIISGTQSIKQNGEEQKITITGSVRPADVSADNTVLSSNVADAQLRIDGKGPLTRKQRQGILTQVFNFLF